MKPKEQKKKGLFNSFLNVIEKAGNKLPHPATIFLILCLIVVVASEIVYRMGGSATYFDAKKGEEVTVMAVSLLNPAGLRHIMNTFVDNFMGFEPIGTVLVAMLGVGLAEGTGLINAVLKKVVLAAPPGLITAIVIFMGINSNIAADAGYIVLIPLGGMVFASCGRHPIAGITAAFAGVSGGFSANILMGTLDPLLCGITNTAIKAAGSDIQILPTANYFFLFASTFMLTIIGTIVTEKIVEPRLGEYKGEHEEISMELSSEEKKGLKAAGIALLVYLLVMVALLAPSNGWLREPVEDGTTLDTFKPFLYHGVIPSLMLFFFIPGLAFGKVAGTIKSDKDVVNYTSKSMASLGGFLVLAFTAAQFLELFKFSNLGTLIAYGGAEFLKSIHFTGIPLIIAFIIVAAFINLFIGSASAKWGIMAPIFVPMMMLLGITPEFTQLAYRIGDSCTNIISPLMSYFAVIITFANKYDKDMGIGTLISVMIPYSLIFLLSWIVLLLLWAMLHLPIGPGAVMFM